ncbi:MAG: tRNA 2-selenouridine(34) synthase MnmH [Bacteroidetes bacterium GWA2_31_9]|nr:MAG: tRNA 2-selenouridine(34) synthase MnmH [Bacteroidetes bacterium GWA2_31_9]
MISQINIEAYYSDYLSIPIIDVRTPAEFQQGHIPNALNIPIFSNEERVKVGTNYKQQGKDTAILVGLEFVGPKLRNFVKSAKKIATNNKLILYCWRGGMRSKSMAWLFDFAGIEVLLIKGGYKAYRNFILESFEKPAKIIVLGGKTGSGKSEILRKINDAGEQFIDLEGIANHKGSAFGALGQNPQPSTEYFENLLYEEWRKIDLSKPLWLEDESMNVGQVAIPRPLFQQIRNAFVFNIDVDKQTRIKRLVDEYASFDTEDLSLIINRIAKRLGGLNTKLSLEALHESDFAKVADLTLTYYDKAYLFGLSKREQTKVKTIKVEDYNHEALVEKLIQLSKELWNK